MVKLKLLFASLFVAILGGNLSAQDIVVIAPGVSPNSASDTSIINHYWTSSSEYFRDPKVPQFIFSTPNNKFSLGIGGYVNVTGNYEFKGYAPGPDLIPYNVTTPNNDLNDGQLNFDARTSRLFFKVIDITPSGKDLIAYIETDFRGGGSNFLRLRKAYVSYGSFLVGQDWTTMLDLSAFPAMVNFQGPNGALGNRQIMVRYTAQMSNCWKFVVALEEPSLSLNSNLPNRFYNKPQRYPQIPAYVQYTKNGSHVRLSGLLNPMIYRNTSTEENHTNWGWAAQLSGIGKISSLFSFSFNGFYGVGIGNLTQDLSGSGFSLVPTSGNTPQKLDGVPVWGGYGALVFNTSANSFISGGYSFCKLDVPSYYRSTVPDWYKEGQIAWANFFWNPAKFLQVGVEYNWGKRTNTDGVDGTVHRVSAMVQYNF